MHQWLWWICAQFGVGKLRSNMRYHFAMVAPFVQTPQHTVCSWPVPQVGRAGCLWWAVTWVLNSWKCYICLRRLMPAKLDKIDYKLSINQLLSICYKGGTRWQRLSVAGARFTVACFNLPVINQALPVWDVCPDWLTPPRSSPPPHRIKPQ